MILCEQQLKSAFHGARQFFSENGETYVSRFTEQQVAYYKEKLEEYYYKSFATASVTLRFVTDADALSFDYRLKKIASRTYYAFDLYVDDVMIDHKAFETEENATGASGHVDFALPEGTHEVVMYLPNLMITYLSHVELVGASIFEAVPEKKRRFFFIGDSITQGYDALYPSMTYVNRVAKFMDAEVINNGIGGEKFDPKIVTDDIAEGYDPELVIVAYGTNDWNLTKRREDMLENAKGLFLRIKERFPNAQLAYISPIWRRDIGNNMVMGTFDACIPPLIELAEACGFYHIKGLKLTPHTTDFLWDAWLHPNDAGFSFYAENLIKAICEIK